MGKIIQIEVPDCVNEQEIKKDIQKIIALKLIKNKGSDVSEKDIDELAEEIKEDMWSEIKKWLKL